jgi:cytidyltransferase-like protein
MRGVYPGSFNPPTIGHVEIMRAAIEHFSLGSLDLVVSARALGKENVETPSMEDRVEVLRSSVAHLEVVEVVITDLQLIADIAEGYDVVVMGADKWSQVNDPGFYESAEHLLRSLRRLPRLAIAARGDVEVPEHARLPISEEIDHVSSTGARAGSLEWMTPEAREFATRTGAWQDQT